MSTQAAPVAADQAHPLTGLLEDAARGRFPPPDGSVLVLPSPPGRSDAVVAFTAHHVVAADVPPADIMSRLPPNDLGAPMSADFLSWLGRRLGSTPGMVDLVLVTFGALGVGWDLQPASDLDSHPRVARSHRLREDVHTYVDSGARGVVTIGRGLCDRWEVSIEVKERHRGRGVGRTLARAARGLIPEAEPLFAQVTPGNVASLRCFLSAGYRPIGSEVLYQGVGGSGA